MSKLLLYQKNKTLEDVLLFFTLSYNSMHFVPYFMQGYSLVCTVEIRTFIRFELLHANRELFTIKMVSGWVFFPISLVQLLI